MSFIRIRTLYVVILRYASDTTSVVVDSRYGGPKRKVSGSQWTVFIYVAIEPERKVECKVFEPFARQVIGIRNGSNVEKQIFFDRVPDFAARMDLVDGEDGGFDASCHGTCIYHDIKNIAVQFYEHPRRGVHTLPVAILQPIEDWLYIVFDNFVNTHRLSYIEIQQQVGGYVIV